MNLLEIVRHLESPFTQERYQNLTQLLKKWNIPFTIQTYGTGHNIIVRPDSRRKFIGISSHYDVVPHSPGANDNASAMAVCLAILQKLQHHEFRNFDVYVFFFDEEERNLIGSKMYVQKSGIGAMMGLINLEMVGQGNQFALWSLDKYWKGKLLETFEKAAQQAGIVTQRFDQIVAHYADHISFRKAGLADAFTLTCISDKDREVSYHYYRAQEFEVDKEVLQEILQEAPLFQHYHKPSDKSIHLSEETLQMTVDTLWETLLRMDVHTPAASF